MSQSTTQELPKLFGADLALEAQHDIMPKVSELLQASVTGILKPEQIFYLPSLV